MHGCDWQIWGGQRVENIGVYVKYRFENRRQGHRSIIELHKFFVDLSLKRVPGIEVKKLSEKFFIIVDDDVLSPD